MRILLTGGGTAGHVIPNLAVSEELKGEKLLYIGSKNKIDRELVEGAGIEFQAIFTGKLRRYLSIQNFVDLFKIPIGFFQSIYHIHKFQPDVIFSKGGFVAVPVVFAGWILRKKIVIHEADASPGLATKLTGLVADKILTSYEETKKYYRRKKRAKIEYVGLPIRPEIAKGSKKEGYKLTGFNDKRPVVLVMGGSLGAVKINNTLWSALTQLIPDFQVVHICGKGKSGKVFSNFLLDKIQGSYSEFEYIGEEMKDVYAITDIIVSRAGANSLAEIEALGLPSILVPLPSKSSRGDQLVNAKLFRARDEKRRKIIKNEKFTSKSLVEALEELKKLSRHSSVQDPAKPAKDIAKILKSCVSE